jgi:hypothetical protein
VLVPSFLATSGKFADWKSLVVVWIEEINHYCSSVANNNPYWHGEQTNMAFLTGITFKLFRCFSLTEFPSSKVNPQLILTYGRDDCLAQSVQSEYFVEAKHIWLELNQPD